VRSESGCAAVEFVLRTVEVLLAQQLNRPYGRLNARLRRG